MTILHDAGDSGDIGGKSWAWKFVRLPALVLVLVASAAILALIMSSADHPANSSSLFGNISLTAIASSSCTLVAVSEMIIIDLIRPYTIFSTVISELLIVFAIAGISSVTRLDATKFVKSELLKDGCKNTTIATCYNWVAIQNLFYLNWIILDLYWVFLLVSVAVRVKRGHKVLWKATVRDKDFLDWYHTSPSRQASVPVLTEKYNPLHGQPTSTE